MPDFGCCVWNEYGVGTGIAFYFSGNEEAARLEEVIERKWLLRFETAEENDLCETINFDWASFHAHGEKLSIMLKQAVGDYAEIYYEKPIEDPDYEDEEFRLIAL